LAAIQEQLETVVTNQAALAENVETKLMSGLTDLNAAIAAMQAEWTTFLADLTNALANDDPDAAVEAAAQLIEAQTAALTAEDAVVNPPAAA
jgi:hypothetical protein